MKSISILSTLLVALLAINGSDAAKCGVKTTAPASSPAKTAAPGPAPAITTKAPAPARPTVAPAAAPTATPAAAEGDGTANKSTGCGKTTPLKTGTFTATVNGKQRQYMVRVPQNYNTNTPYRVVFTFHWRGGTMQDAAKVVGGHYGLEALAKESTIFVSPQGLNAGWANSGGEDIALVDAIVKAVDEGLCVNQNQRFATGFSYGAAMSHSVACSRPDKFRAVAVLSGAGFSACAGGTKPIAYMVTHGVSDSVIPIASGRQLRDHFVKVNGCTAQTAMEPAAGSGTHIKTEYKGCSAGHPVVYIPFDGPHTEQPKDKGDIQWTPKETWNFFTQFE